MITGDFRSAVHAAAAEIWRLDAVVEQVLDATDEASPAMLQYARENLRATPTAGWDVLSPDGDASRRLWNAVRLAVIASHDDPDHVSRVVWLLWEHHTSSLEWDTLRHIAMRSLEGVHADTVSLSDVVDWMTAEGEQRLDFGSSNVVTSSPSAWFRGGWAWCVIQEPRESPFVYDAYFQAWPTTSALDDEPWMIDVDVNDDSSSASLDSHDGTWDDVFHTRPIKRP